MYDFIAEQTALLWKDHEEGRVQRRKAEEEGVRGHQRDMGVKMSMESIQEDAPMSSSFSRIEITQFEQKIMLISLSRVTNRDISSMSGTFPMWTHCRLRQQGRHSDGGLRG